MSKKYDVVIAGGGHNGLVLGCYLAKAGLKVCIVERNEKVGGGVMTGGALLPHVRASARAWLNGYLPLALLRGDLQQYIVAPGLGERSGVMGALSLALRLLA